MLIEHRIGSDQSSRKRPASNYRVRNIFCRRTSNPGRDESKPCDQSMSRAPARESRTVNNGLGWEETSSTFISRHPPIVHGMDPVSPRFKSPVKRLLLIVADGLRADKFFDRIQKNNSEQLFLGILVQLPKDDGNREGYYSGPAQMLKHFDDRVPFVMAALLIFKLFIPFMLVICTFSAITKLARVPRMGCYFLVILFSDVMTIYFIFKVQNTGSWTEIGNIISHFGIVSAQVVFVLLLFALTNIYTKDIKIGTHKTSRKAM
ncbi:hypothetical protein NE237_021545 [Protea cynaroides]|uniref:GPI ethanolamine phosphate transferase 1 n=1 Tax=Protea cynaroides TaxID=273540 RepID=A0A9Q0H9B8_9MAGN|nr:hypothetical protein NE237_021545 [Protea cynaroides]